MSSDPLSELGSKSYIFMENDRISLANLFQHVLSAEILSE